MQQKKYIVGLYLRLSQEDERQGESLSIENQRTILRKYAEERSWEIYDEYIDDGVSGTTFNRPEVQRLLDDAKTGIINTIIVKDLSRFGRNYIEVGQYIDYVFPSFGIRFIAIQDNVDTENRDNASMEMMPIMNVFNEWHAANTSKKIRAVKRANALEGIFQGSKAPYGYKKGNDAKHTLIVDEETAPVVRRIFEMYAAGVKSKTIAETLNDEGIDSPGKQAVRKEGYTHFESRYYLWEGSIIRKMLSNLAYIGHLAQMKRTSISYKNHKSYTKDENEWIVVYNTHEPIISQELWDKVQERRKSTAHGRQTKRNMTHPLSGFLVCADCGDKMKMGYNWSKTKGEYVYNFNCGNRQRFGKSVCFTHHILARILEEIVLGDIRELAQRVILDEEAVREEFFKHNEDLVNSTIKSAMRELKTKQKRLAELKHLIEVAYEDRVKGKMPEDICLDFIQKYSAEQKTLSAEVEVLEAKISETETAQHSIDDFIQNIKKYINAPTLTREMCYELIDHIKVGGHPKITGSARTIEIVYKADIVSILKHQKHKKTPNM